MNAYEMLLQIRDGVGERTEGHFFDDRLLANLNAEHRKVYRKMVLTTGDWFLKKSSLLTPASNQIVLPSDCSKPVYLETSGGAFISLGGNIRERAFSRIPYIDSLAGQGPLSAYMLQSSIEVNTSNFSSQVYLWYVKKLVDLHAGLGGAASGSLALEFESTNYPSREDDYYNGEYVEVVVGTGAGGKILISDYTGNTKVAILTSGTYSSDSYYGTLSMLPEEVQDLVVLGAIRRSIAKPSSNLDKEVWKYYQTEYSREEKEVEEWISTRVAGSSLFLRTE